MQIFPIWFTVVFRFGVWEQKYFIFAYNEIQTAGFEAAFC
jgi:hypothetical protein